MIYYSKVEKRKLIFKKKLIFHEVQSVIIFGGKTLPSEENIEKLSKFFHVDKSEIDPRFSSAPKFSNDDLDEMLDNAHSYDGKPLDDHDRELIRQYLLN